MYICNQFKAKIGMQHVLSFLTALRDNNNREWFKEHKKEYELARKDYDTLCQCFLLKTSEFDDDMSKVNLKDAMFRIYRDIRFSIDKSPYKTHFGAFMAYPNGRKSHRGGYYLHIQPGNSFLGIGVWRPAKAHLYAIRKSVFDHYQEFKKIIYAVDFKEKFGYTLNDREKLKKIPVGFPTNFPEPELLKYKNYLVSHPISDNILMGKDVIDYIGNTAQNAYPFLSFLNEAIDE